MNLTEFLEELRKTRNGWVESLVDGEIRKSARRGEHCPITAVCVRVKRRRFGVGQFQEAAKAMGMSEDLAEQIVYAADGIEGRLRSRLLKAVGLK